MSRSLSDGTEAVPRPRLPRRPVAPTPEVRRDPAAVIPRPLQVAAALSWRLLAVAAALYVLGRIVAGLAAVVVPVAIAVLLAALLAPAVDLLVRRGTHRGVATALVLVGGLAVLGGLLTLVVITFVRGVPALRAQLADTSPVSPVGWPTGRCM